MRRLAVLVNRGRPLRRWIPAAAGCPTGWLGRVGEAVVLTGQTDFGLAREVYAARLIKKMVWAA